VRFEELEISGVFALELEPVQDSRGFFARTYSRAELAEHGIDLDVVQASVSFNERRGTLRGMHLQRPPSEEAKLVRCVAGAVHDVVVDLRPGSPTQLRWLALELSAKRRNALYIPPGLAHGFVTLENGCELEYLISAAYEPSAATGVRWDDPALGIEWPLEPAVISERDAAFRDLDVAGVTEHGAAALP
jgi:dTDP-4-dehydrorhamnose 3,5-epimerase